MHRVRMLQHFGVTPFIVFDGDYLPSKAGTEEDRRNRRAESKKLGMELLRAGKPSQAHLELQKAIDVTPEMARLLIDELKKVGVDYIVAPYEADAQMVYLERKGFIDGILSEDSDLLVFGAKCLLTKLDQYGSCIEVNRADFCAVREVTLTGWTDREFRHMAILSGCDYLNSINNMGLKTAYRMVRKYKTIEKVIRMLQFDGKFHVPKSYLEAFYQAELTFLHQRVYCPRAKCLVYHTRPEQPLDEEKTLFIGGYVEPEIAQRVASGELNPMTKLPIHTAQSVLPRPYHHLSWQTPQRASTQDSLKTGVSIERFFKPKRVPLAELNGNTFTPSPKQQEALARNGGSWESSPLAQSNTPVLNQVSPSEYSIASNLASPSTRTFSGRDSYLSGGLAGPEPRPQKRARLCADEVVQITPAPLKASLGRSRYFESSLPDPSPSFDRRSERRKKEDITIYSDDSIEEALRTLPDVEDIVAGTKARGPAIPIFNDNETATCHQEVDSISSTPHKSATVSTVENSREYCFTTPNLTQRTSSGSSCGGPVTPKESVSTCNSTTTSLTGLTSRFAFTPLQKFGATQGASDLPTPPSSGLSRPSRIPLVVKQAPLSSVVGRKPNIPSALSSLGSKALNRSATLRHTSFPTTPTYSPVGTNKSDQLRSDPASGLTRFAKSPSSTSSYQAERMSRGVPFPEVVANCKSSKQLIAPEDIQLPVADDQEMAALAANGSEDAIFSEDEISETDDSSLPIVRPSLGLSRFAFSS